MRARWLILFIIWTVGLLVFTGVVYYALIRLQGMTITSWWRSPWKNAEVGGVPDSKHLVGLAWDVVPVTRENEAKLSALGLKVINEGNHLHAMFG
jgi:hypothetical protein